MEGRVAGARRFGAARRAQRRAGLPRHCSWSRRPGPEGVLLALLVAAGVGMVRWPAASARWRGWPRAPCTSGTPSSTSACPSGTGRCCAATPRCRGSWSSRGGCGRRDSGALPLLVLPVAAAAWTSPTGGVLASLTALAVLLGRPRAQGLAGGLSGVRRTQPPWLLPACSTSATGLRRPVRRDRVRGPRRHALGGPRVAALVRRDVEGQRRHPDPGQLAAGRAGLALTVAGSSGLWLARRQRPAHGGILGRARPARARGSPGCPPPVPGRAWSSGSSRVPGRRPAARLPEVGGADGAGHVLGSVPDGRRGASSRAAPGRDVAGGRAVAVLPVLVLPGAGLGAAGHPAAGRRTRRVGDGSRRSWTRRTTARTGRAAVRHLPPLRVERRPGRCSTRRRVTSRARSSPTTRSTVTGGDGGGGEPDRAADRRRGGSTRSALGSSTAQSEDIRWVLVERVRRARDVVPDARGDGRARRPGARLVDLGASRRPRTGGVRAPHPRGSMSSSSAVNGGLWRYAGRGVPVASYCVVG